VAQRRPYDQDEVVVLFVKMVDGHELTPRTKTAIATAIRTARTPRHVPKYIFQVPDIPYTMNGKKVEQAVKAIISHGTAEPNGAVRNPESFKYFERFYEIERQAEIENIAAKI
jgi:acetoacetyl-CoA synthetase